MDTNIQPGITPSVPSLLPPGTTTQGYAEQTVDNMIAQNPELASIRDELVVHVTSQYEGIVTKYEQRVLDHMTGANPVLNLPKTAEGAVATEVQRSMENPWLASNPYAKFCSLFLELSAELSKIKLNEGMLTADTINTILSMSKDSAELIKAIYENEAMTKIISAVANAVDGVACLGGGYMGITRYQTTGMAWTGVGQGVGQITNAAEKAADAVFTFQRANLEFVKTIIENATRVLQDRGLGGSAEAYKTADDLISQLLQALNKMVDEGYKAHGFQVH